MNTKGMGFLLAASALTLPGCIISVNDDGDWDHQGWNQVDRNELQDLVATNREATLGMSKAETLGLYPDNLTSLRGSAVDQGHQIEVWSVTAVSRNRGNASFSRWLCFYDGELVELSEDRVDWNDEDTLNRWRAN
ncbi:MAG: hypothetical protein ACI89L_000058 [Phycisphaerales bacterium]|jgi:hypothetical protein